MITDTYLNNLPDKTKYSTSKEIGVYFQSEFVAIKFHKSCHAFLDVDFYITPDVKFAVNRNTDEIYRINPDLCPGFIVESTQKTNRKIIPGQAHRYYQDPPNWKSRLGKVIDYDSMIEDLVTIAQYELRAKDSKFGVWITSSAGISVMDFKLDELIDKDTLKIMIERDLLKASSKLADHNKLLLC